MAEAIHCPSCSTRYRLRVERVRPAIRRAKCFSCGSVFPVGDIVQRLLALPSQASTATFAIEAVDEMQHASADLPPAPPPLTLGDLEGVGDDLLEKTLIDLPGYLPETKDEPAAEAAVEAPPAPEPPTPEAEASADLNEPTASGYTSARDAIDKLFGSAPAAPAGLHYESEAGNAEMEATLTALASTLGSTQAAATPVSDERPTASGLTPEDLDDPSRSTVRLTQADLAAALAAKSGPEEPTVALMASDLVMQPEAEAPAPRAFQPLMDAQDSGAELLRLKIGEDIYGGLTMPQLITWVEEGRILETHLVARQHSENWLEAHKVPGLRPVFDRLRRERSGGAPTLSPALVEPPPRKSLFGGLFGKN